MLTKKEEKFVQEYIRNGNNRKAAYKAAFGKGVKDSTAYANAHKILQKTEVKLKLEELNKRANAKAVKASARARKEVMDADEAAADMRAKLIAFYTDVMDGKVCNENECLDKESGAWVVTSRSIKASDRIAAAEKLSKLYGIEEQPAEEIQIELVCGAEELAN